MIKTEPARAKVWVDDRYFGHSPALVTIPRSRWKPPFKYRIEKEGYLTEEGYIHQVRGGGRITGAVFSLGISLIFKRPHTLKGNYVFPLTQDPQFVQAQQGKSRQESAARRLEDLERLRSKGLLSEAEFQEFRAEVIKDLSGQPAAGE
jgi:hypothetical protein